MNIYLILTISIILFVTGVNYEYLYLILLSATLFVLFIISLFIKRKEKNRSAISILLVTLSILFSLAIIEAFSFFVAEFERNKPAAQWATDSDYPGNYFQQPLEFGSGAYEGIYRAHKIHPDGTDIFNVIYKIGKDRFRVTNQNLNTTRRINFFGGSFTFGEAVDGNETLPYYFSTLQPNYYVKNFGFHGWGVHEALAIMESNHDTKGNINFLLTSPWHSDRTRCIKGSSSSSKPMYKLNEFNKIVRNGICLTAINEGRDFVESTTTPIILSSPIFQSSKIGSIYKKFTRPKEVQNKEIIMYLKMIERMLNISNSRGQDFFIGFIKSSDDYLYGSYSNDSILEELHKLGIKVVDMTLSGTFESLQDKYIVDVEHEGHPSALAHYERAIILSNFIEKQ